MNFPPRINRYLTALYLRRRKVEWQGVLPEMDMLRPPQFAVYGRLILGSGVKFITDLGRIKIQTDNEDSVINIGSGCVLNGMIWIKAGLEITIGDNTLIAPNVKIFDHKVHPVFYGDNTAASSVHIGRNVWIASDCLIEPGSTIGENTVVGWNSRTVKRYPSNALIAGNPARVIEVDHKRNPAGWIREGKRK